MQGLPKDKPTPTRGKLEKPRNDQRSRDSVDNVEHSNGTRKSEHTKQKTEQHQNENADLVTDLGRSEKSDSKRGSNTARDGNVERRLKFCFKLRLILNSCYYNFTKYCYVIFASHSYFSTSSLVIDIYRSLLLNSSFENCNVVCHITQDIHVQWRCNCVFIISPKTSFDSFLLLFALLRIF